jgi:hypothetical protein
LFTNVLSQFFCSYLICSKWRHDTFSLDPYRFHWNYQTSSDTKKEGCPIWLNTLAKTRTLHKA